MIQEYILPGKEEKREESEEEEERRGKREPRARARCRKREQTVETDRKRSETIERDERGRQEAGRLPREEGARELKKERQGRGDTNRAGKERLKCGISCFFLAT